MLPSTILLRVAQSISRNWVQCNLSHLSSDVSPAEMEHPAAFPFPEGHTPADIPLWAPAARGNECTPSNYSYETFQSPNFKISPKCVFCLSLLLFCFHRKEVIINKLLHKSTRALAVWKLLTKTSLFTASLLLLQSVWSGCRGLIQWFPMEKYLVGVFHFRRQWFAMQSFSLPPSL